jgi:ankyrin repeat protein
MHNDDFFNAIRQGDHKLVEQLLRADAGLIHCQASNGLSPILAAVYQRQSDIAELLISQKVLLDVFEAAATGRVNHAVRILARKPELANAYSADGFQPLALAAYFGQTEVVEFLLHAGAEINSLSRNDVQATPLNSAAAGGHVEAMRLLLEYGADPNACQGGGVTSLHIAAQNGNLQAVLLLLHNGADLRLKNNTGKTALDLAREAGHLEVVELLRTEITKRFRSSRKVMASQ